MISLIVHTAPMTLLYALIQLNDITHDASSTKRVHIRICMLGPPKFTDEIRKFISIEKLAIIAAIK